MALYYWLIDVRPWRARSQPFVCFGLNPVTIRLLGNVVNFDDLAACVLGGPVAELVTTSAWLLASAMCLSA